MIRSLAALVSAAFCFAIPVRAQSSTRAVTSVRVTFQKVDQVALDFGVDTAAMRQQAILRLNAAGIAVKQDTSLPELQIAVRVPRSLAPVDLGLLSVDMVLLEPKASDTRRTLWHSAGIARQFTRFGSLRDLVPEELDSGLAALAAAQPTT
jgi:hypothetical protein